MCLMVRAKDYLSHLDKLEYDLEKACYIGYKVITLKNTSPFNAGGGFQWVEGRNVSSSVLVGFADRSIKSQTATVIKRGFHLLVRRTAAETLMRELSAPNNPWSVIREEESYKVIKVGFQLKHLIATGMFDHTWGMVIEEGETDLIALEMENLHVLTKSYT